MRSESLLHGNDTTIVLWCLKGGFMVVGRFCFAKVFLFNKIWEFGKVKIYLSSDMSYVMTKW